MPALHELEDLGQGVWLDFIRRSFIASGGLREWIDRGARGVTSNPTILDKAIAGSADYDEEIRRLALLGKSAEEIYLNLALEDIGAAADLFLPIYESLGGRDGYVSLEVSPLLAYETEATIAAVRQLSGLFPQPNVFIKVPATAEGVPAIRALISQGISINVTLIFSLECYREVLEAYLGGLEDRFDAGQDITGVASVASFFVSRVDTAVDKDLEARGETALLGKAAIANAKAAYAHFLEVVKTPRWRRLADRGARVQRPLWASTSTKNPNYPDTLYIDNLIGPDTVNTVPLETLDAWLDHGRADLTLMSGLEEAQQQLGALAAAGIDLDAVTDQLTREGVQAFADSYHHLLASIEEKRRKCLGEKAA
ncbi:MAG: transaldolase [Armatimonadota bacterium]